MEHVQRKHDSHLIAETVAGFSILAFVMLGVGMTVYRLIAPDGWMARLFGHSLSGDAAALVSVTVIAVVAWFSREWITPEQKNRYADLFVYTFAGAGAIYLVQLWLHRIF